MISVKKVAPVLFLTLASAAVLFVASDLFLIYFIVLLLSVPAAYLLTIFDQKLLFRVLKRPFVNLINIFNRMFKSKFHSAMLLTVGKDLVPYVDYGHREGVYIGIKTNALVVGDYLIKHIEENNETGIRNTSNWLLKNFEDNGNYILWKIDYPRPDYNLKAGWVSGLYQGRALKALCMLWERTQDEELLGIIKRGINAFEVDMKDGGFKVDGKHGYWFEEYPEKGIDPPFVLNGFVESLLDLYYAYEKTGIERAKDLFEKGLKELKARVNEFDTGSWTYYDLLKHPARFDYHQIHIREMMDMFKITGDKTFYELSEKWKKYKKADWRFFMINLAILDLSIVAFGFFY